MSSGVLGVISHRQLPFMSSVAESHDTGSSAAPATASAVDFTISAIGPSPDGLAGSSYWNLVPAGAEPSVTCVSVPVIGVPAMVTLTALETVVTSIGSEKRKRNSTCAALL